MQVAKQLEREVLFARTPLVKVAREDVRILKDQARANARQRIRLCAHQEIDDPLHEMLIVHDRDTYVRPHKHLNKSEAAHIIEGAVDVVLLEDDGCIRDVMKMGAYSSGRQFYYRLGESCYHTLLIRSSVLVFLETTNGPFRSADTVFAPWAPAEDDAHAIQAYRQQLEQAVGEFRPVL